MAYVDDLLFLGEEQIVNKLFKEIQQHFLLRPAGALSPGNSVAFLGRNITNRGDHYESSLSILSDHYTTTLPTETNLQDSKPAPAPGTSALKTATADHEQALSAEEHAQYRRAVGKPQWMTYTRPNISYATKELARALQQPTTADQQRMKHLLRYIKGTKHYKQNSRPRAKIPAKAIPDLNVFVDSAWAGCPATTRRSATGFIITLLGTTINYGSRTQATIALKCRGRTVCHQHRSRRSTSHQKSLDGTSQHQQDQYQDPHRLFKVAKAWPQELDPQERQSTLNSNIFSFNR